MNSTTETITTIAASVIGLATLAVIFSQKANTPSVISTAGSAFSGIISAAVAPITGGTSSSSFNPASFTSALGSAGDTIQI